MTIRDAILTALRGCSQPVGGREVATLAGQSYKPVIDALNRMLDMGRVHRLGRTHTARWTTTPPPEPELTAAQALDAAWFGPGRRRLARRPPRHGGGRPEVAGRAGEISNDPTLKNFRSTP